MCTPSLTFPDVILSFHLINRQLTPMFFQYNQLMIAKYSIYRLFLKELVKILLIIEHATRISYGIIELASFVDIFLCNFLSFF